MKNKIKNWNNKKFNTRVEKCNTQNSLVLRGFLVRS